MKVSFFFDQGSAKHREDGLICTAETFGVLDGMSTPYKTSEKPVMYGAMSSGEMVVRMAERIITSLVARECSLESIIKTVNREVARIQKERGIPPVPEMLAGTAFALARVGKDKIEVMQTGDCFAVIGLKSGGIVTSPYQSREYEIAYRHIREELFSKIAIQLFKCSPENVTVSQRQQFLNEFWEQYPPICMAERKRHLNNPASSIGFGSLNGQEELFKLIWRHVFYRARVGWVLFFSDGMISSDFLDVKNDGLIGETISYTFFRGGWPAVWADNKFDKKINHIVQPEATGLSVEF